MERMNYKNKATKFRPQGRRNTGRPEIRLSDKL
jgi:hypothetical protein